MGARLGAEPLRDGRQMGRRTPRAACRPALRARRQDPKAQADALVAVQPGIQAQREPQFPASKHSQVLMAARRRAPLRAERRASLEPLAEHRSERGAPAPQRARQASAPRQRQMAQTKQELRAQQAEQPERERQRPVRPVQQAARAELSA